MGDALSRSVLRSIGILLLAGVTAATFSACIGVGVPTPPSETSNTSARSPDLASPSIPVSAPSGRSASPVEPTPSTSTPAPEHGASPFPDESTTGVPDGIHLQASESLIVTEPGTVIEGLDVQGKIDIQADNVTIRNSRVTTAEHRYPIHVHPGVKNAIIEFVEVSNENSTGKGIFFDTSSGIVRHSNIHSGVDGIFITGDDVTVEDCYIHHLFATPSSHNDTIQIRSGNNIHIRNNNLQAYNDRNDNPMNAAIQIGSLVGNDPIQGLVVEHNLMNGGSITVNLGRVTDLDDAVIRQNRFGRDFRYAVVSTPQAGVVWEASNVYDDTGEPAP
ncbi:hypothetical protein FOJ82_05805 [Tessaracoccus rhinocerotis]|uniref:Right handed beta helix domain-containing protein n=1 Tax=Tessaracoccus rhinocerotis TaxID=1689449 RepID=A0A553K1Q3_9ACTN|nr:right-handed parallel beta-helix repeat-containing protein [Tessaracoccus rhinocerotis]TRY18636.1 hypothetical protein FOJ82_05805 [Tessaracoccus rhinocerotis]